MAGFRACAPAAGNGIRVALGWRWEATTERSNKEGLVMAMARFSVMYFGHFILFSVFLLFYVILLVGLIARIVKRSVAEARQSQ
jgi:hypothetical protein